MESKKPWQSKTLWINLIMAGLAFVPAVQAVVTPEVLGAVFGAVNAALRLTTKSGVSLKD